VDAAGFGQAERVEDLSLGRGQFGALAEGAGRAGEGAQVQALEFFAQRRPGRSGAGFGDADEQQREPAQQDVGADARLGAVVDRAQVDDLLWSVPDLVDTRLRGL
jgi:hypothetical protein